MNEKNPLSVKQLNAYLKGVFESDFRLADILVRGELSNFKNHYASGHWYFTLKDKESTIRCVMFKNNTSNVNFVPEDGIEIVIRGRVSVYEKDGQYMLYASEMHDAGIGDLAVKYAEIKEKLRNEGLFDESNKRPLPKFPGRIAVITSDSGAALRDVINILNMRFPVCDVMVCPAIVQGTESPRSLIENLNRVYKLSGVDLIIIGRGGGSAEDLAPFNDETLARTVYESPIPVISAVGHETDVTICDLVADVRASTPSHAAEMAVPDMSELFDKLNIYRQRMLSVLKNKYELNDTRLSKYGYVLSRDGFERYIEEKGQLLDTAAENVNKNFEEYFLKKQEKFFAVVTRLDALSPYKLFSRGYAFVKRDDETVTRSGMLSAGDNIELKFSDGSVYCTVTEIERGN